MLAQNDDSRNKIKYLHFVDGNQLARTLHSKGLHFAFLDPYNLGAFNFRVIEALARLERIDMLVHVSKMDLQRNLGMNVAAQQSAFDVFASGWRDVVNTNQLQPAIRREVFEYWRGLVASVGIAPSANLKLITGSRGQHLYWLLLAAKHEPAHRFWANVAKDDQGNLFQL